MAGISASICWIVVLCTSIAPEQNASDMMAECATISWNICNSFVLSFTFYLFILLRLRLTFQDTIYQIPRMYFILITAVALTSLSLYTFVQVYWNLYQYDTIKVWGQRMDKFSKFCIIQFYVLDALIRAVVMYSFNHRLFKVVVTQTDEIYGYEEQHKMKEHVANELNERQRKLVTTITRQTLLICTIILANLVLIVYGEVVRGSNLVESVLFDYVFMVTNAFQLLCLYLGFDFAAAWYFKCCAFGHTMCARICKKLAVKKISSQVESEYDKLIRMKQPVQAI